MTYALRETTSVHSFYGPVFQDLIMHSSPTMMHRHEQCVYVTGERGETLAGAARLGFRIH